MTCREIFLTYIAPVHYNTVRYDAQCMTTCSMRYLLTTTLRINAKLAPLHLKQKPEEGFHHSMLLISLHSQPLVLSHIRRAHPSC